MFLNPPILILYWSSIHKKHKEEIWEAALWHKGVENDFTAREQIYRMKLRHTIAVHSIPAIWTVVLMLMNTNTVLMKRHAPYLAGFCIYYGFVNYIAVFNIRDGRPIYSFITWRD